MCVREGERDIYCRACVFVHSGHIEKLTSRVPTRGAGCDKWISQASRQAVEIFAFFRGGLEIFQDERITRNINYRKFSASAKFKSFHLNDKLFLFRKRELR